jgi:hypothetical protein
MISPLDRPVPKGFVRTCWRGVLMDHPSEWEPAMLSGPKQPAKCVLVDRRSQRLQIDWQEVERSPDLDQMFQRLGKGKGKDKKDGPMPRPLSGVPGWTGIVVEEQDGPTVVRAGRHFPKVKTLVQVAVTWPGRRNRELERQVLAGIRPLDGGDQRRWQAMGLSVDVPPGFELDEAEHRVGHLRWQFVRPGRPRAGLMVERIAAPEHWLEGTVEDWARSLLPSGTKVTEESAVPQGGHEAVEIASRKGGRSRVPGLPATVRLDRAWICPADERAYHLALWRGHDLDDLPDQCAVFCCPARDAADVRSR